MTSIGPKFRPRPAHPPGPTFLTYTPNGTRLITAGSNNIIRMFITGSDDEPDNVLDVQEQNAAVVAADDFFIAGSEDGTVWKYSVADKSMDKLLVRCALPIRDLALSPDTQWVAVSSDEITVKIVNVGDMEQILYLREQPKPIKHVTFDPSGSYVAASCTDGNIYLYEMSADGPTLYRKIDGVIRRLETDAEATSRAVWHPDGRLFAVATATRDIVTISISDGEKQRTFSGGHMGDITAIAWSPNGAMLASAASDGKILLWETRTQKIVARYDYKNVTNLAWHPTDNVFSCSTSNGEIFIQPEFIQEENIPLLKKDPQPSPFIHDPLAEPSGYERRPLTNGGHGSAGRSGRQRTPDSLDEILGPLDDEDDFIDDDDGAGYTEGMNGYGKRTNGHLDQINGHDIKRRAGYQAWAPKIHNAFQPGSTPWRGNRKYLCLNLIGFVWTVDQDTHNTVTVEFYDREFHRDFHFTDPYLYDKACLNENGTLFSCPPANGNSAMIFYRPHETWTSRADWRTQLPEGEDITAISLSESFIVVTTTKNYVRVYTLFGTPFRVYRQKSSPMVTCASWRDYVLTLGNGPVGGDGSTKLLYTIENVKRDEVCQNEDVVALCDGAVLKNVFFSDNGDPCIYDSNGVLLTLLHWRLPGQAKWVPLLDTKTLERLAGGKKEETYWPVAVAQDKFHCIILKGGDQYPYFPRPLLSEFDFKIPLSTKAAKGDENEDEEEGSRSDGPQLEESFVRSSIMLSLMEDLVSATTASHAHRTEVARKEIEVDKVLLQLLAVECREGEERGMRALELVGLMRDRGGKMIDAAGKVAGRFGRTVLEEKIRELAERRLMGIEDDLA